LCASPDAVWNLATFRPAACSAHASLQSQDGGLLWQAKIEGGQMLNLTLSEFSAGLWAKREGMEQSMQDLDALSRSLQAIEPFASPLGGIKAVFEQGTPIQVFP
jgi:hypothetical protein